MKATKRWNNESVSVAHIEVPTDQTTLAQWWGRGTSLKIDAPSEMEALRMRMALRVGNVVYTASKRHGYILLEARIR